MPEIGTSGLMSGDGKRGGAFAAVLAPILDSTDAYMKCTVCVTKCIETAITIPLHMPPKSRIINEKNPGVRIAWRRVCSRSSRHSP